MTRTVTDQATRPATAARIYDYFLGGVHNYPADRQAATAMLRANPLAPAIAQANRAFLRRTVKYLLDAGVRQFLDIGSGIPTVGNVHEVAQAAAPDARVVYVDIDPVAVAESLEILDNDPNATAVHGDLSQPKAILANPAIRELIDFGQPVGVLLASVLHFLSDDEVAYPAVAGLVEALGPGSYLVISHSSAEDISELGEDVDAVREGIEAYRTRTRTPFKERTQPAVERFFEGLEMVEPGLVWIPDWRPAPDDPTDFTNDPAKSVIVGAVGRKP
jgi:hypothetical protein